MHRGVPVTQTSLQFNNNNQA